MGQVKDFITLAFTQWIFKGQVKNMVTIHGTNFKKFEADSK